jgi:hypothetical protein
MNPRLPSGECESRPFPLATAYANQVCKAKQTHYEKTHLEIIIAGLTPRTGFAQLFMRNI